MTDPPFLSISKTKGLSTGKEKYTPTVKGPMGFSHG
jgi:hypothetical protein